jgi:hypothetical protein
MLVMNAQRVVPLIAASRRRPAPTREQRVVYEMARLRVASTRGPERRFAHIARAHD